jgi:single-strand DNA-binding protein
MIQASIYGRLGRDPETRQTKNGNDMVTASIAVDATPGNAENPETIWFSIMAFGKTADTLARHQKGDLVSLSGRITQSRWTGKDGEEKTSLTLMADAAVSARTVRPNSGRKKADEQSTMPGPVEYYQRGGAEDREPFNGEVPF